MVGVLPCAEWSYESCEVCDGCDVEMVFYRVLQHAQWCVVSCVRLVEGGVFEVGRSYVSLVDYEAHELSGGRRVGLVEGEAVVHVLAFRVLVH